jgi:hypothetical protein
MISNISASEIRAVIRSCQNRERIEQDVINEMAIPSYVHWNPAVRWIIRERFKGDYHERSIYDIERVLKEQGWTMTQVKQIPWFLPVKMFRVSIWKKK